MQESECVETGGELADCGDLANLSAQSKQCVSLWSNRIWLLLSPTRLTRTHTISKSPAGPPNRHTKHTSAHYPKSCCHGSSTEPDRQTSAHANTHAHTPDDSTNTCCRQLPLSQHSREKTEQAKDKDMRRKRRTEPE